MVILSSQKSKDNIGALPWHETDSTFECFSTFTMTTDKLDSKKVIKSFINSQNDRRNKVAVTISFIVVIAISNKTIFLYEIYSNNVIYFSTHF